MNFRPNSAQAIPRGPYKLARAREAGFELLHGRQPINGGLYVNSRSIGVAVEAALNDAYPRGFNHATNPIDAGKENL